MSVMRSLALRFIARYQERGGGTAAFGVACNFEPSCSEYTRQAIERVGLCRGLAVGWRRLRRCRDPDRVTPLPDPLPESPE